MYLCRKFEILQMIKKTLLIFFAVLCCMVTARAENPDATMIDGIYYILNDDGTASVTWGGTGASNGTEAYTGDISIPGTVSYNNEKVYTVTAIGADAFHSCPSLTSVDVPASVKSIGAMAFGNCTSLKTVKFAEDSQLESIEAKAFCVFYESTPSTAKPAAIATIEIPASVRSIGDYAFYICDKLTNLTFAAGSQLESIGKHAFQGTGITTLNLPSSLMSIGEQAFRATNITMLDIPASVMGIAYMAFGYCAQLTHVNICATDPSGYNKNAFFGSNAITAILVPGDVDAYKALYGSKVTALSEYKTMLVEDIDAAVSGTNTISKADMTTINEYKSEIAASSYCSTIVSRYTAALKLINAQKTLESDVKDALGSLGTKQEGPAIEIVGQDGKTFRLYNPKQVKYIKVRF